MLISRVPEEDNGNGRKGALVEDATDNASEYHTASELFEIMASNLNLRSDEDDPLTTSELLLIYKNIDLGTKLMSNDFKREPSNQYVESIVYEDLDSDSEISEINSSEDIHNLMMINDERINLLTQTTSSENTLCEKIRNYELCSSNITIEYDRNFLFKHPYLKTQLPLIQKQLSSLNLKEMVKPELPVTLLDYICCKRFEEHYNFDMDNIIRYVKLTIEQLKRISNGDYLTDKAKAKWREVDDAQLKKGEIVQAQKVLANNTNIPLHVERKVTGHSTKWDDLVHSSVDIRSLSKILEKKIIVEVPKILCGSYKLLSKCCDDNLIIRCKRDVPSEENKDSPEESRVDVVVQLNRSKSGHVMSNINSIIILQKSDNTSMLPLLSYKSSEFDNAPESDFKDDKVPEQQLKKYEKAVDKQVFENSDNTMKSGSSTFQSTCPSENISGGHSPYPTGCHHLSLGMTSLPEESTEDNLSSLNNKKRSPTRNRIKSPYENKSFVIEEKKRRRLLEVKQRREKNKLALSANGSKVNKHKFPLPPQTSSSVTKLSITNKSFYNSIYGENMELKPNKIKNCKECISEISSNADSSGLSPEVRELNNQKYVNKSYFLDNAVTEMMYLDMKNQDRCSEASSTNDYKMHFKILTKLLTPSDSKNAGNDADLTSTAENTPRCMDENNEQRFMEENVKQRCIEENDKQRFMEENNKKTDNIEEIVISSNVKHNNTPNISPMVTKAKPSESELCTENDPKKATATAEFRKSIDKIYELMNKLGKSDGNETKLCKSKFTAVERPPYNDGAGETSTIQCSDSGTSVKHQLTSSNPSCFSFEKTPIVEENLPNSPSPKGLSSVPASKVIISSKSQNPKVENDKTKKDRKRVDSAGRPSNCENPLKAITQFLHEIDNVQKNRSRAMTEKGRKPEVTFADIKVDSRESRPVSRKAYKTEQQRTDHNIDKPPRVTPKERKMKVPIIMQAPIESVGPGTKTVKKKVFDLVDEMKEARGEAVRGPSKLSSRLNSLAQPRKAYIEAQIEEFQARYGKSIVTDRLQKLSGSPSGQTVYNPPKNTSPKYRRRRNSPVASLPKQPSNSQPTVLEKPLKKNKCDIVIPLTQNKLSSHQSIRPSSANSTKTLMKKKGKPETPEKPKLFNPEKLFSPNEFISNGKTRVPFIPNEIELASIMSSVDESSTIGIKIHEMIDVIVHSPPDAQQSIVETNNKEINANLREESANFCEKCQSRKPANEKFTADHHHERSMKIKRDHIIGDTIPEENDPPHENEVDISPTLKTALFRRVSTGSFHKHLKHKAPKDSMQQVLLLQSGDSNSVILRSTISQNLEITNSKSDLSCLSELTNLDLKFTPFPIQMPIVAYSFPIYDLKRPRQRQLQVDNLSYVNNNETISTNNISIQCYKGEPVEQFSVQLDEFDMKELNLLKTSPSVIVEELEETKPEFAAGHAKPEIKEVKKAEKTVIPEQQTKLLEDCDTNERIEVLTIEGYRDEISESNNKSSENNMKNVQSKECLSIVPTAKSSTIDYTTSLDILVGLLDEIQNITTCQSQIANTDVDDTEEQLENMETILKSAAALERVQQEARNIISISSLDKLRQLESNASILSFYISSNSPKDNIDNSFANFNLRPLHADKEVSAMLPLEYDNKCTNVPSRLFPLTVSHSTNVSSSLIGVLSQPSSHSLLTYNEYPLQSATSMTSLKNINLIKLPKKRKEDEVVYNMPIVVIKDRQLGEDTDRKMRSKKVTSLKTDKQKFVICNKSLKVDSDFDPVMKMKRDILVTMYSVLVFTVFAALSFPEILYRA